VVSQNTTPVNIPIEISHIVKRSVKILHFLYY
jgi:hypothetical protein